MTDRRVRPRRRLTVWLVVALLGAAGTFTIATPAQAATTCTTTFTPFSVSQTPDGQAMWYVNATLTNTGAAPSTDWHTIMHFHAGTAVVDYWNVTHTVWVADAWYAAGWYKVVQPGGSAYFGYKIRTPSADVLPQPYDLRCSIKY